MGLVRLRRRDMTVGAAFFGQVPQNRVHRHVIGDAGMGRPFPPSLNQSDQFKMLQVVGQGRRGNGQGGLDLTDAFALFARTDQQAIHRQPGRVPKGF